MRTGIDLLVLTKPQHPSWWKTNSWHHEFLLAAMILVLLGIGLMIGAAAVSAPWIYTIF